MKNFNIGWEHCLLLLPRQLCCGCFAIDFAHYKSSSGYSRTLLRFLYPRKELSLGVDCPYLMHQHVTLLHEADFAQPHHNS